MNEAADYLLRLFAETKSLDEARKKIAALEKDLEKARGTATQFEKGIEDAGSTASASAEKAKKKVKELTDAEVKGTDDAVTAHRKKHQEVVKLYTQEEAKASAATKATMLRNRNLVDAELATLKKSSPEMFKSVPDWSANANRARFQTFQLTSAFQDLAIVLQNGGTFDRALLGASNNLGVMASTAALPVAVLGTLAVVAIPSVIKGMIEAAKETENIADKMSRAGRQTRELVEHNLKLADSYRAIAQARFETSQVLGTPEARAAKRSLADRISEVAAEKFSESPQAVEGVREHVVEDELKKISGKSSEAVTNRDAARLSISRYAARMAKALTPDISTGRPLLPQALWWAGDIDKLLDVAGEARRTWQGRFATLRRPSQNKEEYERLIERAISAAIEKDNIKDLPEEIRPAAEARKKFQAYRGEVKEDRAQAIANAQKRLNQIVEGKDIQGLQDMLTPEAYAGIVRTAEQREEAESRSKRDKIIYDRTKELSEEEYKDRIADLHKRVLTQQEEAATMPHGSVQWHQQRLIREAQLHIQQLEKAHEISKRGTDSEDKHLKYLEERSQLEKDMLELQRAQRDYLKSTQPSASDQARIDARIDTPSASKPPPVTLPVEDTAKRLGELLPHARSQDDLLKGIKAIQEEMLKDQKETNMRFRDFLYNRDKDRVESNPEINPGSGRTPVGLEMD